MPSVVKAVSTSGIVMWLHCGASGIRSVSIRPDAEVFQTAEEALAAIAKMPAAFTQAGLKFVVEDEDQARSA